MTARTSLPEIIGRCQHDTERRARIAQMQAEPHNSIPDYCQHGLSYAAACVECEADEADLVAEFARAAAEPGIDRADVEGGTE